MRTLQRSPTFAMANPTPESGFWGRPECPLEICIKQTNGLSRDARGRGVGSPWRTLANVVARDTALAEARAAVVAAKHTEEEADE